MTSLINVDPSLLMRLLDSELDTMLRNEELIVQCTVFCRFVTLSVKFYCNSASSKYSLYSSGRYQDAGFIHTLLCLSLLLQDPICSQAAGLCSPGDPSLTPGPSHLQINVKYDVT